MPRARTTLLCTTLLVGGLGLAGLPFTAPIFTTPAAAQQRVEIRSEFRVALEPHGQFERHSRYGEVWRPARVARDWRPYTVGRWVYNDDLGWYWNAAESEADWGWVAFHYGRWVNDQQMGWIWVPGDEWAPAWVNWRRGEGPAVAARGGRQAEDVRYIGWAPLPPDDVVVEYRDNPDVWIFVRARDIVAPRVNTVIIRERRPEILQRTVVVNRTVVVRDRGVIVNPGIAPSFVAAFIGRPVVSYDVRPRVIAGTSRYSNAVEIRADDLRDRRRWQALRKEQPVIRETRTRIEAARDVPQARALEANEQGRLGDRPPRAAQRDGDPRRDRDTSGERSTDERSNGRGERAVTPDDRRGPTAQERPDAPARAGDARNPAAGRETNSSTERSNTERRGATDRAAGDKPAADRPGADRSATDRPTGEKPAAATGRPGSAPGRNEATPGQAQTAPGRAGDTPGQSGAKPPGQVGATPGQSGANPGRSADAPGRERDRGAQREERAQPQRSAPERNERAQPAQREERSNERGGGRGEVTGATPNRSGGERGARDQQPPARPDASEQRGRPRENQ